MPRTLLSLPYDIRYLIYQHLLPREEQIYIQAVGKGLRSILPADGLPTNALLVCRQVNAEASGYLYNNYLFNIVGTKKDCLATYHHFLKPLRKHARNEVRINAFSNGEHSSTMCISMEAGDAKLAVLNRRRRGEPKAIHELEQEQHRSTNGVPWRLEQVTVRAALCGLFLALLVWLLVVRPQLGLLLWKARDRYRSDSP